MGIEDLFFHVLSVLHDPSYRRVNADGLSMGWPRIPLPGWPSGRSPTAAQGLARSAGRGRELAALLNPETPVRGVTKAPFRPELEAIAKPSSGTGGRMSKDDCVVSAGWGRLGRGGIVMPHRGRAAARGYDPEERTALTGSLKTLGENTYDICLNERAYWKNVPSAVWHYQLGGYQVLKKWLSYREHSVLGRPLTAEEVRHFTDTARRIAAILLMFESKAD